MTDLDLPSLAKELEAVLAPAPPKSGKAEPKPKPEKGQHSSMRASLKHALGDDIAEDMANSIRAALNGMKTEWIECQHCHKKTPFRIENMYERVKAAQLVLSELEGKVGTHREAPPQAKVKAGDLEDLSDDDLLALLGGTSGETEDSQTEDD